MHLNPHYPVWYLMQFGFAAAWTGQYTEAIAALKQLLIRNPNFMAAYYNLAAIYVQQWAFQLNPDPQVLERALEAAQQTITLSDTFAGGYLDLGQVYLFQKQYDRAIVEMERSVALAPDEAIYYAALAEALSRAGGSAEAIRMVNRHSAASPAWRMCI